MINSIRLTQIFVNDQDEALDFYVGKLGLEVKVDQDLGFMRWLTIGVPGEDREIFLERPGEPGYQEATVEEIRQMVSKGAGGGWIGFATDDCRATYEDLVAKGVEFSQEPVEQSYGIDCALRDPFGNHIRIVQRAE
ncbi:MAG: VOC family protein [Solirubrobacterales bacterium]|nr:VOC family protein [Solirubrobacterales bacterium]MCB8969986.1 VOC family protein [Thermoleophilales bacterium]MCO5327726.1 VOC family protein [Solirubrobacterales bacterium]